MIKGLPEQWWVWVPTDDISRIIRQKLIDSGYREGSWSFRGTPYILATVSDEKDCITNYYGINEFSRPKKEITLRAILEGEAEEVKEKSLDEKIQEIYDASSCSNDTFKAVAKLIVEECKK